MDDDDFDYDEYSDVPGLSRELALAWHRFRKTAGWPKPVEAEDLTQFAEEAKRLGGLTEQQVFALLEGHSGFDGQDWEIILEELGYPPPES